MRLHHDCVVPCAQWRLSLYIEKQEARWDHTTGTEKEFECTVVNHTPSKISVNVYFGFSYHCCRNHTFLYWNPEVTCEDVCIYEYMSKCCLVTCEHICILQECEADELHCFATSLKKKKKKNMQS